MANSVGAQELLKGYETSREAAQRLGIKIARMNQLLNEGRIPGAIKVGKNHIYLVPKDAWPEPKGFGRPPLWEEKAERAKANAKAKKSKSDD